MIWQVIVMNGQQRHVTMKIMIQQLTLALVEEAVTATASITLVFALSLPRLTATVTFPSVQFYICRAERCENQNLIM